MTDYFEILHEQKERHNKGISKAKVGINISSTLGIKLQIFCFFRKFE